MNTTDDAVRRRAGARLAWGPALLASMLLACAGAAVRRGPTDPAAQDAAATPSTPPADAPAEAAPAVAEAPVTAEPKGIPGLPELQLDLAQLQAEYDIPIEVNDDVVEQIRQFQAPEFRSRFLRWLSRAHRYLPRFRAIMRQEGLPEDTVYLAMIESGFVPLATSRARAVGPWQFIAATGKRYGLRQDRWVDERRDPEKAALAAARFLRDLHQRTGDWHLAWAAYNAGPGRISRAMDGDSSSFWELVPELPAETRAYVPKLLAAAIVAKHPEAFGFGEDEIEPERWVDYQVVTVRRSSSLASLARAAGVTVEQLRELNPELRTGATPPRAYALRLPPSAVATFDTRWPRLSAEGAREAALAVRETAREGRAHTGPYRVRSGESLWSVSRRLGVSMNQLASWNGIRSPGRHKLRAGRFLKVGDARSHARAPHRG